MRFVEDARELKNNIATLNKYLEKDKDTEEFNYAIGRIKQGSCFVVICDSNSGEISFYPSRFIGYKDNNMFLHGNNHVRDGRETNRIISKILRAKLITMENDYAEWIRLEKLYEEFCNNLGFTAPSKVPFRAKEKEGSGRKYWLTRENYMDIIEVNTPFDYILAIKDRPGILFGNDKSLGYVHFYIHGFRMGRWGTNLEIDKKSEKFLLKNEDGFQMFVMKKFNVTNTAQPWFDIIERKTNTSDEAFALFYELIEEFFG